MKLRDFIKNLKKQGESSKEPDYNFKIPFCEKIIRKCEEDIQADTRDQLIKQIKDKYKDCQKAQILELKKDTLIKQGQVIKAKEAQVDHHEKFKILAKELTDQKKSIPTHSKITGKVLSPSEQIKIMEKMVTNQRKMKIQKINKNLK